MMDCAPHVLATKRYLSHDLCGDVRVRCASSICFLILLIINVNVDLNLFFYLNLNLKTREVSSVKGFYSFRTVGIK